MTTKKVERKKSSLLETNRLRTTSRKLMLAYVGAFGVAGDELGKLFALFVKRGERVEQNVRQRMERNGKLAHEVETGQKAAEKANKTIKKAAKKVESFA